MRAVGTGPSDAGLQKIYEKLEAEKDNSSWDIDVAVIHQKAAGEIVTRDCWLAMCRSAHWYARQFRSGKARARRQCRSLRDPDVQQPDRDRLQHAPLGAHGATYSCLRTPAFGLPPDLRLS